MKNRLLSKIKPLYWGCSVEIKNGSFQFWDDEVGGFAKDITAPKQFHPKIKKAPIGAAMTLTERIDNNLVLVNGKVCGFKSPKIKEHKGEIRPVYEFRLVRGRSQISKYCYWMKAYAMENAHTGEWDIIGHIATSPKTYFETYKWFPSVTIKKLKEHKGKRVLITKEVF